MYMCPHLFITDLMRQLVNCQGVYTLVVVSHWLPVVVVVMKGVSTETLRGLAGQHRARVSGHDRPRHRQGRRRQEGYRV